MWLLCMYRLSVTMFVLYTFVITIYLCVDEIVCMCVCMCICVYIATFSFS